MYFSAIGSLGKNPYTKHTTQKISEFLAPYEVLRANVFTVDYAILTNDLWFQGQSCSSMSRDAKSAK